MRSSSPYRRSPLIGAGLLGITLALCNSACADDDDVEDAESGDEAVPIVEPRLGVRDPGTDRALISCAAPKPYPRCNVFGRCRCSAYP